MEWSEILELEIPYGYCQCGCGQKTNISTRNDKRYGHVKGQPFRFLPNHQIHLSLKERFWSHVNKNGGIPLHCPELGECWIWVAKCNVKGYGQFIINKTVYRTHRLSWFFVHGTISDGLFVLHKCDNPSCVNPDHLFLGTNQDNVDDMINKGRQITRKGENNGNHKLTENDVITIRNRYAQGGITYKDLGDEYHVNLSTIYDIVKKRNWK